MNRKNKRSLATSFDILDGVATIWLMPIPTLRHNMVVDDVKALFNVEDNPEWHQSFDPAQRIFYLIEGHVRDFECQQLGESHDHRHDVDGLQFYFENRNGNIADNWENFVSCVTIKAATELYAAWNGTRRVIPKIESEILKEPPPDYQKDPKETGSGRKPTKKKSSATSKG